MDFCHVHPSGDLCVQAHRLFQANQRRTPAAAVRLKCSRQVSRSMEPR